MGVCDLSCGAASQWVEAAGHVHSDFLQADPDVVPEYIENQKQGLWVTPESDEDIEDAVGLRV